MKQWPLFLLCCLLFSSLLHAEEYKLIFSKKGCEVSKLEQNLIVSCELALFLKGVQNQNDLFIKEEEVEGTASGDFIIQSLGPLSGLPNLYHNPFPFPLKLSKLKDNVMTMIDLNRPRHQGSLRWSIPVSLTFENGTVFYETEIIQEFILDEGNLILKKGGLELIRVSLKDYSKIE